MKDKTLFDIKYLLVTLFSLAQIIFGLTQNSILEIFDGLYKIIISPGGLISDYIGLSNMGAAFVNSGIVTLLFVLLLYKMRQKLNGVYIAALFTIAGFSLFGKNLFNVWFIILGVKIYSLYKKENFSKYLIAALFGTALAPVVSEVMFSTELSYYLSIPLGMLAGMALGFVIPALGASLINVHHGFNLYNIGFTAGMIGTVFVSVIKSYGFESDSRFIWTSGNNFTLAIYLFIVFSAILSLGFYTNGYSFKNYKQIMTYSGRLITDFVQIEGVSVTLINIGITGFMSLAYILLIGGDLNGPTIGGILTIAGFSAFGKHPKNISPIFLGVFLGSLTKIFSITDPSIQLAALFGTALAPIAGEYGWKWGVIAAFIHSSVVLNVGYLHGGLNLYNNGFSAGLVAAIMIPVIGVFGKDD
jgi:hypothetical protein